MMSGDSGSPALQGRSLAQSFRQSWISGLLAFAAGSTDTIGFVALFGLFSAHVTGNFVLLGAAVAHPHVGSLAKLLALPVFVASVAAARLFERYLAHRRITVALPLVLAELVLLVAFCTLGVTSEPITNPNDAGVILAGLCGVFAMGFQNALGRTVSAAGAPTTVMTGNVTQLAIDAVDILCGDNDSVRGQLAEHFRGVAMSILCFAGGALAGGAAYLAVGFAGALVPIAAVSTAALVQHPRST
jgi:uncharacterized membrane protein YoaK (UPF0700 family)